MWSILSAALLLLLTPPTTVNGALIFRDDFGSINASCGDCPPCHTQEGGCSLNCTTCPWELSLTGAAPSHSTRTIIPCPVGRAGTCILFNVTYCGGSGKRGPCYRSELSGRAGLGERPGFAYGQDYWFGFSFRLPDGYSLGMENPQDAIHFQMHGSRNRGEAYRDPIFELRARPTHPPGAAAWWVSTRGDPRGNMTAGARGCSYKWYNETWIGKVVGGRWESFVYHTRFVHNAPTGFVELWRNGAKVISWHNIGTAYNDVVSPYMKIGIYKWGWEVPRAYDVTNSRVVFSELRVGDAGSSFAEVDTAPPPASHLRLMKRVANFIMNANTSGYRADYQWCGWQRATYLVGHLALARAVEAQDAAQYVDWALGWAARQRWQSCVTLPVDAYKGTTTDKSHSHLHDLTNANNLCASQAYLTLCSLRPSECAAEGWMNSTDQVLSEIVARPAIDDWWWSDALFMAMPTLAMQANRTHDARYIEKLARMFDDSAHRRGLWNAQARLFFESEAYQAVRTPHGALFFWGRGSGWAIAALTRVLAVMPVGSPHWALYAEPFKTMSGRLISLQRSDGFFTANLLDPAACPGPETTSTALFVYSLAWGVNHGLLSRSTFSPVIQLGWRALQSVVADDGSLGFCQPAGGGTCVVPCATTHNTSGRAANASGARGGTADFCAGQWLLAATETLHMQQHLAQQ